MMNLQEETVNDVVVLAASGRLDSATSPLLGERLAGLAAVPRGRLVLDLAGVSFISSAGLRVILAAAKHASAARSRLLLCSVQPQVREVLDISGFSSLLDIHGERAAALGALA